MEVIQKHGRRLWAKAHLNCNEAKFEIVLRAVKVKFEILLWKQEKCVLCAKEERHHPVCYECSFHQPASLIHSKPKAHLDKYWCILKRTKNTGESYKFTNASFDLDQNKENTVKIPLNSLFIFKAGAFWYCMASFSSPPCFCTCWCFVELSAHLNPNSNLPVGRGGLLLEIWGSVWMEMQSRGKGLCSQTLSSAEWTWYRLASKPKYI